MGQHWHPHEICLLNIISVEGDIVFFIKILFIFREGKGGRKRGRETSMCGCLSSVPYWGPGPQPRHMPSLRIEPAILWVAGWHSIH